MVSSSVIKELVLKELKIPTITFTNKLIKEITTSIFLTDPETKQKYEVRKVNWESASHENIPTVDPLPNMVDFSMPAVVYSLGKIAAYSEQPIICLAQLGTGKSSRLNDDQKKELKKGNFSPISDSILRTLKSQGIQKINLIGYSMGAQVAAHIAASARKFGITVQKMVLGEPSGGVQYTLMQLIKASLDETDDNDLVYTDDRWELQLIKPLVQKLKTKISAFWKVIKRFDTHILEYGNAVRRQTLIDDTIKALREQQEMKLDLIVASEGSICPISVLAKIKTALNAKGLDNRFSAIKILGAAHAFGLNNLRLSWLAADLINS